ncbi:hypothetical protein SLE2022_276940 [Rubroshorea leprosula]
MKHPGNFRVGRSLLVAFLLKSQRNGSFLEVSFFSLTGWYDSYESNFPAHTTEESVLGHPNPSFPPASFMSMLASFLEDALAVKVKTDGIDIGGNIIKPEDGSTQVQFAL